MRASLITTIMLILLLAPTTLFLHLNVSTHWRMASDVESQLHSLVLADNGIEYARTLLPLVELNPLLLGPDGTHCGTELPEWRSPMSFREAVRCQTSLWRPSCDDGLAVYNGQELLPGGYRSSGGGRFFLKFSNNPEEPPGHDEDHVILVRSLGMVPNPIHDPFFPTVRNGVALIETRLRQERSFLLTSPLTLFGDRASFQWQGALFSIQGEEEFAISIVSVSESHLLQELLESLTMAQGERIQGHGIRPSIRDAAHLYRTHPIYRNLFSVGFWSHLLHQLPDFADTLEGNVVYLPNGGVVDYPFSGILIARGDLVLRGQARIEGLLLHLGSGKLALLDGTQVTGGVWMSNLDTNGESLKARSISLQVSGTCSIRYERAAILKARAFLPPTQLGWRILFPETVK